MIRRYLAIAWLLAACGTVNNPGPTIDGGGPGPGSDATTADDAAMPITYRGSAAQTAAFPFGGTPYCNYTETLKQLEVELLIAMSGSVVSGEARNLNVEGIVGSCPNGVIPATQANYTLQSATPTATGAHLVFRGASSNNPGVSLVGELKRTGSTYAVDLTFHRGDQPDPLLAWTVTASLPLSTL